MDRPPDSHRDILSARRQLALLRQGAVLATAALVALVISNYVLEYEWPETRTMIFTALVLVQLAHAFSVRARSTGRMGDSPGRNRLLIAGVAGSALLQLGVVYLPVGNKLFDTVGLPALAWPIMAAITLGSFVSVNLVNARVAARRAVSRQ